MVPNITSVASFTRIAVEMTWWGKDSYKGIPDRLVCGPCYQVNIIRYNLSHNN